MYTNDEGLAMLEAMAVEGYNPKAKLSGLGLVQFPTKPLADSLTCCQPPKPLKCCPMEGWLDHVSGCLERSLNFPDALWQLARIRRCLQGRLCVVLY